MLIYLNKKEQTIKVITERTKNADLVSDFRINTSIDNYGNERIELVNIYSTINKNNNLFEQIAKRVDFKDCSNLNFEQHIFIKNRTGCYLFAEYSGFFQLYCYTKNEEELYFSTSFTALLEIASTLTFQKQECLEYINVSTTFNNKTIFKEIDKVLPGAMYNFTHGTVKRISKYDLPNVSYYDFRDILNSYTSNLNLQVPNIYCDISGGYDTRTIVSALLKNGTIKGLLANNRSLKVSPDIIIAKEIANAAGIPLHIVDIEPKSISYSNISTLEAIDFIRGWDVSFRLITEVQNKAKFNGLVVGGWGAEMLRNQHGKATSISQMAGGFGFSRIKFSNPDDQKSYHNNIIQKITDELNYFSIDKETSKVGEYVFYFVKARHWAGSMLTLRNNYVSTLFPFYDPKLAFPVLGLDKSREPLQIKLIKELAPELSTFPFSSSDSPIKLSAHGKLWYNITNYTNKVLKKAGLPSLSKIESLTDYPFPLKNLVDSAEFSNFIGFNINFLFKNKYSQNIPRYYSLVKLWSKYSDKIKFKTGEKN